MEPEISLPCSQEFATTQLIGQMTESKYAPDRDGLDSWKEVRLRPDRLWGVPSFLSNGFRALSI